MRILLLILLCIVSLFSANRHFDLYKMDSNQSTNRLLVIGGIHGNEPGGYFAPAFLIKYYKIKEGGIWVVPNLNFDSLLEDKRGIYGDMNRKFSEIKQNDPDFEIVSDIKKLILDKGVDFVINLHDGHGFYRASWESAIFNPKAWGQAYIIDQKSIDDVKFGNLDEIASKISGNLNSDLSKEHHSFGVKNTNTKFKDEEMQMSLTYFAITNLKPALAIETSKNIQELDQKVYYQLKSIEELMGVMGIKYERSFELTLENVQERLKDFGEVCINGNITLPLSDIRSVLRYVPMAKEDNNFSFTHPLGGVKDRGKYYEIMVGNISLAKLYPQYFKSNCDDTGALFTVDGKERFVSFGEIIDVTKSFQVKKDDKFRVNIIGLVTKNKDSQDGIVVKKGDILERFSIDNDEKIYRIEFYNNGSFCGMVAARFI